MRFISGIMNVASCWTTSCTQSSTGRTCSTTKNIRRVISAHNAKVAAVMRSQLWPAPPPATDQASALPIRSSSADTALVTPQQWGRGDGRTGGRGARGTSAISNRRRSMMGHGRRLCTGWWRATAWLTELYSMWSNHTC